MSLESEAGVGEVVGGEGKTTTKRQLGPRCPEFWERYDEAEGDDAAWEFFWTWWQVEHRRGCEICGGGKG